MARSAGGLGNGRPGHAGGSTNYFLVRSHERKTSHHSSVVFCGRVVFDLWTLDPSQWIAGMVAPARGSGAGELARSCVVGRAIDRAWRGLLHEILPKRRDGVSWGRF